MTQVIQQSNIHSSNNSVSRIDDIFLENNISTLYDDKIDPFIEFFKWIYYKTNFNDFQLVYFKLTELNDLTSDCLSNIQIYIHESLLDQVQDYVARYKDFVNNIFTEFIPKLESFRDYDILYYHHTDIIDHIRTTYTIENITSTQYQIIPTLQQIWIKRIQKINAMYKAAEHRNYSSKYISNDDFLNNVLDQISDTFQNLGNGALQIADNISLSIENQSNENDYEKGTWRVNNGSSSVKALTNGSANESTDESESELYENKSGNRQQRASAKKTSNSKKGKKNKNCVKGRASVNLDEAESTPIKSYGCFSNSKPKEKQWYTTIYESAFGKKKKIPVLYDDETSCEADDESKSFGFDAGPTRSDLRKIYERKRDKEDDLVLNTEEHFHDDDDKVNKKEIRKNKKKLREIKLNSAIKIKRTCKEYLKRKKKAAADLAEKECLEKLDEANKLNLKELSLQPYNLKLIGLNYIKKGKILDLEVTEDEEKEIDKIKNDLINAKPVRIHKNDSYVSSDDDCDADADTENDLGLDELNGSSLDELKGSSLVQVE